MKSLIYSSLVFTVSFLPTAVRGDDAPITAALPKIPDAKFNLTDFGAQPDSKTLSTEAFEKAVAAIEKAGGGHLIVPAGTYKTLSFELTSHMDLHLEPGATIKASEKFEDYGIADPTKSTPASHEIRRRGRQQKR